MDKVLCLGIGFGLGCFYMKHKMEKQNNKSFFEETKETFSDVVENAKEKIHNATAPEKVEAEVVE